MVSDTIDTTSAAAARTASPAASWSPAARTGAAAALVGGGVLWVVGELVGYGSLGAGRLRYEIAHPALTAVGQSADLIGTAALLFAIPIWLLLARQRSPKLAWAGAILGAFGMVGQAAISGVEVTAYAAAHTGKVDLAVLDDAVNNPPPGAFTVVLLMFFVGAFVGTAISMVALWRARSVPRGALVLWLAFLGVSVASVPVPGTVVGLAALVWMAFAIVRAPASRLR